MPGSALKVAFQTALILLITLLLAETALRTFQYFSPSFIFYSDSYNRYRGKPHAMDWSFKLNSLGFKDTEFSTKESTEYRIVALGDSFAFGVVPYKYNYLTLLEEHLDAQFSQNFQPSVLNMGIPGIGPKDYLTLLVNEGLEFQPDMLLLSIFIGNDFQESKRNWWSYSYVATFFNFVRTLHENFDGNVFHGSGTYCDDCPGFDPKTYLEIEYLRSKHYLSNEPSLADMLKSTTHYLQIIRDICVQQNISFRVVIIPDEIQVNKHLEQQVLQAYYPTLENENWEIDRPNRLFQDNLDQLGIDYIDLLNVFRTRESERLYRIRDTHWNIAGNRLAAEEISQQIAPIIRSNRGR